MIRALAVSIAGLLGVLVVFATMAQETEVDPTTLPSSAVTPDPAKAILRGLDKITGRTSTFEAVTGKAVSFGTLRITVRKCENAPPEEAAESSVFLEIFDVEKGEVAEHVFTGWMFASSPALSAAEHPVYDVWVISCIASAPSITGGIE